WDADRVRLNGIHFFAVENVTTEERMFRNGQVHLTKECALNKIPFYRDEYPEWIQLGPQLVTYYYLLNTTRPEFSDPRVRKALSLTVDREAIVNNITRAGERPAHGYVPAPPEGSTGYQPPNMLRFDPEEARRLLAEAGYPNGEGFPNFEILINTHEAHKKIAEAIQEMWKRELNIEVGIINQSWQVYLDTVTNLNYDIGRRGWIGDYMDPITFLIIMMGDDPNNSTGWKNEEYERLLKESGQIEDQEKRYAKLHEAEKVLLEDMPIIPIYWYVTKRLVHPDLKGFHPKLLDNHNYKFMSLDRDPGYERIKGKKY
ncbi:MAG: peptide ABC transporter substrate-binding protein, partial [Verrucomicrobiota bacterium]